MDLCYILLVQLFHRIHLLAYSINLFRVSMPSFWSITRDERVDGRIEKGLVIVINNTCFNLIWFWGLFYFNFCKFMKTLVGNV